MPDVDGQEETDSLRADKIYAQEYSFPTFLLKMYTNTERNMKFQKELRSRISGYNIWRCPVPYWSVH
ncbi:hypothetical protein TNCV_3917451 [Trichonephila clavipes]|nr:hypothetical protein TNCV_3917451 [Trichonephila clavipes]